MSSHDAYAEPERGRTLTVVLLALLILTVIGALFGFVLGRQDIDEPKSNAGDGQSARPPTAATTQGGEECPAFIQEAVRARSSSAALPLYLQLQIRTDKREVWICQEADKAGLWYQGHDKKKNFYADGEVPKDGENGLLLDRVTNAGDNKYIAISGNTTYTVSESRLVVTGDQKLDEKVTNVRVPK